MNYVLPRPSIPVCGSFVMAEATVPLFDFAGADAASGWQAVNDGVMGGASEGRVAITDRRTLAFAGTLSLANNGGFASVRSRGTALALRPGDVLVVRVRGDGRDYSVNLYVPRPQVAFSYRAAIRTVPDGWVEVRLPLERFRATSFGRVVPDAGPVDPAEVTALGFMVSDKIAGPFELEVEWIRVVRVGP